MRKDILFGKSPKVEGEEKNLAQFNMRQQVVSGLNRQCRGNMPVEFILP